MSNVCSDNNLYYYILNSKKITTSIGITALIVSIIIIIFFIIHYRKQKENKLLKKGIIKTIIALSILFVVCFSFNYYANYIKLHSNYSNCIEEEEILAIEENTSPLEYVEPKPKKEKSTEVVEETPSDEIIEVVEENNDEEDLDNPENAFYFLNVGAGTEAFILQDQGHFGLIDASYNSRAPFIINQLKKLGAEELDFLIITHAHLDHMGGYSKIMSSMNVKTLYIKNPGNVNSDYVPTYLSMIKEAEEKGTTICDIKEELCQTIDLGYIHIQLYNTEFINAKGVDGLDRSRVENANSIAAVATINNRKIYYASDIGDYFDKNQETKTAEEVGDIDVYKAAHHGYISYNNSLLALSYLKPEYTIITNTKELSKTSVNRIKNTSPDYKKTYYTTNGTVVLHINMDGTMEFTQ